MNRRIFVSSVSAASTIALSRRVFAHHGCSSFDENKPIYLVGTVKSLKWQNPHVELVVTMLPDAKIPAELAKLTLTPQTTPVDRAKILATAGLPTTPGDWTLELSPMTRIKAWKVAQPKVGDTIEAVAYTFKDEKGAAVARVEYLISGDKLYGLRSMPA
ncbi:MAG: DUF6152 family protein [Burkholderiales bacterium]